jgi:hypothetical protein
MTAGSENNEDRSEPESCPAIAHKSLATSAGISAKMHP